VAGGVGSRVGADVPKQYIEVAGKPILFHTLEALTRADLFEELVIVMAPQWQVGWLEMAKKAKWNGEVKLVDGGKTRFHSVQNGLACFSASIELVAVHDAVRPIVADDLINRCVAAAQHDGAAIPAISMRDSLRQFSEGKLSSPVDRSKYVAVQTPQCFRASLLRQAYAQAFDASFTDDATVVEKMGQNITIVEGDRHNQKITYPEDLAWLTWMLSRNKD